MIEVRPNDREPANGVAGITFREGFGHERQNNSQRSRFPEGSIIFDVIRDVECFDGG
jgi:hypothetical protein